VTHDRAVATNINKYLNNAANFGHVLIVTKEAYKHIPYFNRRENWKSVIDEIPQVDVGHKLNLPRNMDKISSRVECGPEVNDHLVQIVAKDPKALRSELDAVKDDLDNVLREFYEHLISDNYDTFVEIADWERLVEKENFSSNENINELTCVSMLNTKLLQNSILLGANVEDSLLFHWLKRFHGLRMGPHDEITSRLRTDIKPMSCEISYFFENRNFSKYLYNSTVTGSVTFIDLMDENVANKFGNEPFLYVSNKDRKSKLDEMLNVKKISVHSHGLNDYRDYKAMYFSAALNRTPKHLKVLKHLGFDMEQIRTAESHEITYQSVMRTSLRNELCDDLVRLVVSDKSAAERLVSLIDGSHIVQIGDLDKYLKSVVPLTSSQKNHRVISRRIRSSMVSPNSLPFSSIKGLGTDIGKLKNIGEQLKTCYVTTHEHVDKFKQEDCHEIQQNIQEWIKKLRTMSKEVVDSKVDLKLYCPSVFKAKPNNDSFKCYDCFVKADSLVLDFDQGKVGSSTN
jgi:hypothetical protein